MILYAATSNPGKLAEFGTSASGAGIEVLALPGIKSMPEPVEDADSFMGNAEKKAISYSLLAPGLFVFADDSGLVVTALGEAPGVRSARFADDAGYRMGAGESTDTRNNALLLELLQVAIDRSARFVCALALARDGVVLLRSEGVVAGEVLHAPRGENGFGYDPLFLLPALGLTTAELPPAQKWELSHRGNAFRSLLAQIKAGSF
ncbi:non-canonical purine NTP pyrophosphatase [Granulicella sp. 5B5]|uniref:non-canonical purine NTP pyrophosphatase n=1 Tax=Granulicella sp. 5B5 TaxID=1617967 RepID=UPI0015F72874|nr:non-canonical purine NTP pyrophosphatase [Granulicella sp. 5B5]QMV17742.1 non-canonical purine NTP pyrophosphatase [Granulicella sp. 5B5]